MSTRTTSTASRGGGGGNGGFNVVRPFSPRSARSKLDNRHTPNTTTNTTTTVRGNAASPDHVHGKWEVDDKEAPGLDFSMPSLADFLLISCVMSDV